MSGPELGGLEQEGQNGVSSRGQSLPVAWRGVCISILSRLTSRDLFSKLPEVQDCIRNYCVLLTLYFRVFKKYSFMQHCT